MLINWYKIVTIVRSFRDSCSNVYCPRVVDLRGISSNYEGRISDAGWGKSHIEELYLSVSHVIQVQVRLYEQAHRLYSRGVLIMNEIMVDYSPFCLKQFVNWIIRVIVKCLFLLDNFKYYEKENRGSQYRRFPRTVDSYDWWLCELNEWLKNWFKEFILLPPLVYQYFKSVLYYVVVHILSFDIGCQIIIIVVIVDRGTFITNIIIE